MKITVVTVSYNSAKTIGNTLASVAGQTHPDIEHLVIDGGSKDGTLQVIQQQGAHVARVVSEPDNGIYDAMNKGLGLATGDMVGFLNADDVFWDRTAVAAIADAATRTAAQVVYGDLELVRENDLSSVVRLWRAGEFSAWRLKFGWMPPHPTLYVAAQTLRKLQGFDARYRIAGDYDFMLRCLSDPAVTTAYIPRVLTKQRLGGASTRSARAIWRKSGEDLQALKRSGVGGVGTLLCKNLRKLPQFLR